MRLGRSLGALAFAAVLAFVDGASAQPWRYSDDEVSLGFNATVFGAEHGSTRNAFIVKKYTDPVRVRVVDHGSAPRAKAVAAFVGSLPRLVKGLDIRIAKPGEPANFTVHVVDKADYADTVRREVLKTTSGRVPGRCLVKVDLGRTGIRSSTAVIVSDQGDSLFKRCMVEEILQGLGPMNDDNRLIWSVFNDRSKHAGFTVYDRAILNVLYDPRVEFGMTAREARAVLPDVLASVKRRID